MKSTKNCAKCGVELPAQTPEGLCPKCLLAAGLGDGESEPTVLEPTTASLSKVVTDRRAPKTIVKAPTPIEAIEPGNRVKYFGDYEMLEKIAQGGMGVVYKARQVTLNRVVAVKMILTGQLASETDIRRFHQEAEAEANLQHPNIVAIHEVGEHEGQHYFSMDFVEGENLASMTKDGPLPAIKAAELVKTIAEAIQFAHQRGILHRDLKPHNVLIDVHGIPRITDFGLAKRVNQDSSLTTEGAVMGSPSYMSPEQAAGRQDLLGPASDVYSLGAILYELLTGQPPFRGKTAMDTMRQVIDNEPVSLAKLNSKVPVDLETICLKCLEKKPDQRYSSARMLTEELGRFLNHEPILARPASAFRKTGAWFRRHPWMVSAGLAILVLGLTALAFGYWDKSRYLEWLQTHTAPKTSEEGTWFVISAIALMPICILMVPFVFLDFVDRKRRGFPLLAFHLRVYTTFALVGLALSINFTLSVVHEWVWRTRPMPMILFFAFIGVWFGALLLWNVIKEYRSLQFGVERPEAAVLFPPIRRASWKLPPGTIGDRKAFNVVLLALIISAAVICVVSGLITANADARGIFSTMTGTTCAAWLFLCWWWNTKSASKHVILLFGLVHATLPVAFVSLFSKDERFQNMFFVRGAEWISVGLGLALGLFVLQVFKKAKPIKSGETTLETADYSWVRDNRGLFLLVLGFGYIFLILTARFWATTAGQKYPPALAFLCSVLILEFVFFLRSSGIERRVRSQSLLVWLLGCLATTLGGFSIEEAVREILAGLIMGCALLAFVVWKSKAQEAKLAGS